jgi:hypothetical protein
MSDDRKYKHDSYGIVAVVQLKNGLYNSMEYKIRTYKTEEAFAADAANVRKCCWHSGRLYAEAKNAEGPVRLTAVSGKSTDNGGTATPTTWSRSTTASISKTEQSASTMKISA